MSETINAWFQFLASLALIGFAGSALSHYGDVIARKTGLSGAWVGVVLLATVTSFPELITGISAVTLAHDADIAIGTVLGSCVFNMLILVVLDYLVRGKSVFEIAGSAHILSAGFGVLLVGVVGFNVLLSAENRGGWALGYVGVYTPLIVLVYVNAVRVVYRYGRAQLPETSERPVRRISRLTLPGAVSLYAISAVVVIATSLYLPFVGQQLAEVMGWHRTFVGTLFIAFVTSVPEMVVTVAALQFGAVDMAVANLFGSNMFNVLVVAVDDAFFLDGPILAHVSPVHMLSAFSAMMMTGVAIVGLLYRPRGRFFGMAGWSMILVTIYLLNSYVIYLYGG